MNIDSVSSNKSDLSKAFQDNFQMEDLDFKPLTSGLGFNNSKPAEIKSHGHTYHTTPVTTPVKHAQAMNRANIYQNDLSLFYNQQQESDKKNNSPEIKAEIVYKNASKTQRVFAYLMDLALVFSALSIVLTFMAKATGMDLIEVWSGYPNEITPLVLTLFSGFYLIYFSIFEKARQSTLGKNLLGIRVVDSSNKIQQFHFLVLRSLISLANFISLGLFSYFDLQNKVTHSKVVKVG